MSERDPSIHLDAAETRCDRPSYVSSCSACARKLAPIPASGARMGDMMAPTILGGCANYLPVRKLGPLPPAPRRVHPPLGEA